MKNPVHLICRNYIVFISCLWALFASIACNKKQELKPDHLTFLKKAGDSAYALIYKHKLKEAHALFNKSYTSITTPGLGDQIAYYNFKQRAYFQSFVWNYSKMDLPFVLTYPDSILDLIENNKVEDVYQVQYIDAQITKGDILYAMHNYGEAYSYYYKSKTLTDKLNDKQAQANFNHSLGMIIYREGKIKRAASIFMQEYNQRIRFNFSNDNFGPTQEAIVNAGVCYNELDMPDSAIYCFKKAIAYIDGNASKFFMHKRFIIDARGVAKGYLGLAYYNKGDNQNAEKLFKEAIKTNSRGGTEGKNCQLIQLNLARLYLTTGRLKQTDSMANAIKLSMDTLPNEQAELEWQKLKIDYYNFLKMPQQAQTYLPGYLQLKHKASQVQHGVIENDVDNYFNTTQKNYDQALLRKQKQLTNLQLILFIAFTLFILFVAFQLWNNWNNAKKHNLELTEVNRQTNELNLSLKSTLTVLEQSQAENMRLLKVVAHDLRSPISSMFSLTSLMLNNADRPAKDVTILELIKASGKNCLDLVSELLRVHFQKGESKKETVDLSETLNYCVAQLADKANEKKQHMVLKAQSIIVPGNSEKLWRVVSNLIVNAIKFSLEGATINIELKESAKNAVISIEDHGIGIPDDLKNKIFNMVTETMRTGTAGEPSFGMGLGISKQIIDSHGGKIWFESTEGAGTTFYIELPKAGS